MPAGALAQRRGDSGRIRGEIRKSVTAVRDPIAVAVAALIERICDRAGTCQMLGGVAPGVARLSAAMQQHHRIAGIAIDVCDERIAGSANEHRGRGLHVFHARCDRNSSTPAL